MGMAKLYQSASQQHGDHPSLQPSRRRSCPSSSRSPPSPSSGPSSRPLPPQSKCMSSQLARLGLCQRSHCLWLPYSGDYIGSVLTRYVLEPHPEIVDELLCVFSFLVGVTPEESRYLWKVHRVLRGKRVMDDNRTPIRIKT